MVRLVELKIYLNLYTKENKNCQDRCILFINIHIWWTLKLLFSHLNHFAETYIQQMRDMVIK